MPLAIGIEPSHYSVVSAMITPAFFLTATSSLIATCNARLARVVDRMRLDIAELQQIAHPAQAHELRQRVDQHRHRSRLVLASVRLLYGAVTAFVGTSMAIALDSVIGWHIDMLPMLLAVLGVLLVFLASLCLGREAQMALQMLEKDLDRQLARSDGEAT